MNTLSEKNTPPEPTEVSTHLWNQVHNPCARIFCRSRRLIPTVCDGTCLNCKKERDTTIESMAQSRMLRINADPTTGESIEHDGEAVTYDQVLIQVLHEVREGDARKEIHVNNAKRLMGLVVKDIEQITSPPLPHPDRDEHG